jgi:hypothetical protein
MYKCMYVCVHTHINTLTLFLLRTYSPGIVHAGVETNIYIPGGTSGGPIASDSAAPGVYEGRKEDTDVEELIIDEC